MRIVRLPTPLARNISTRRPVLLFVSLFVSLFVPVAAPAEEPAADGEWIQLFNGKDLTGWTPKIRYSDAGDNYGDTFRVEDGVLKVVYEKDKYEKFGDRFGHLFYKTPYSHYIVRAEYRFTGDQCPGGPGWAIRNSGIMVHGQKPEQMTKNQDFPDSIEVQLLGGSGSGNRSTANLCTPGTDVVMDGKLVKRHCTNSTSKTYHGDEWVTVEVEVHGSDKIIHRVNGEEVLSYEKPQLDNGTLLDGGTISLQSESHPVEFRKVELKELPAK